MKALQRYKINPSHDTLILFKIAKVLSKSINAKTLP